MSRAISYDVFGKKPIGGIILTTATPVQLLDYLINQSRTRRDTRVISTFGTFTYVGRLSPDYTFEFDQRGDVNVMTIRPERKSGVKELQEVMDDFLRGCDGHEIDNPQVLQEVKTEFEKSNFGWQVPWYW